MHKPVTLITFGVLIISSIVLISPRSVSAACTDYACDSSCKNPKVDLVCQRNRLLQPCSPQVDSKCCKLLFCGDSGQDTATTGNKALDVNFFGVKISVDESNEVASIIYLLFTFFFGFVALAVTLLGVYGAFLRSRADSADDEAKASKLLTNAIVGLILIVLSLVFAQVVASSLGIKSLDKLVDFSCVFQTQCINN